MSHQHEHASQPHRGVWTLRGARASDLRAVRDFIASCELPVEGLDEQLGPAYVIAEGHDGLVGLAGVEVYGPYGLLRSVAVLPAMRRAGLGDALVRDRIAWARDHGVEALFLLTTTAESFFAARGFETVERVAAPLEIRLSREFSESCPASATLMHYLL